MENNVLTVGDFYAGAGGASLGIARVPGCAMLLAANHWQLAVDTHSLNFPNVLHDCADISQIDFRRYPRVDILWASPECTNHSIARGVRIAADRQPDLFGEILPSEAAERSRATMDDVPRYLEAMLLRGKPTLGGIVENVVDLINWIGWRSWKIRMEDLGYKIKVIYLNSMFARPRFGSPLAPQSRDRMYVMYWLKSIREPNWDKWLSPEADCPDHGVIAARQSFKNGIEWGRYRAQYVYVCPAPGCKQVVEPPVLPAAAAINWKKPGTPIGSRKRPIVEKTRDRVQAGIDRYEGWPFAVPMEGRDGKSPWSLVGGPMRTFTTRQETAIAYGPGQFLPFIAEMRGGGSQKKARGVDEPLATFCASGLHHALVTPPLLVPYYGNGNARPASDPLSTVTTVERHALVTPPLTKPITVDECLLRMLDPDEIGLGMAFNDTYKVLGTRREQVRQYGNAVTPPAAEVLMCCLVEAITGQDLFALAA
ncbi:DNA cytosine methyltransferase [Streptomyces sp. MBT49]|uniref:DNA cytosine methyltransferase n=1 Tax=Streptomyces sp. MBT49 TaxID=1488380 RepID=UPI001F16ACE3|nr:DNA cytosine methyltransferase [Streptomyces sp. MBT49]